MYETIGQPQPSSLDPDAEQPYRLKLLATFGALTGDPDLVLLQHMERGVPTGIFDPILSSHQWPPASEHKESEALTQLDLCTDNWKAAEEHPQEVAALIEKEIEQGWVEQTNMSLEKPKPSSPKGWPSESLTCSLRMEKILIALYVGSIHDATYPRE